MKNNLYTLPKIYRFLLTLFLLVSAGAPSVFAQISRGGVPRSFRETLSNDIPVVTTPPIDLVKIRQEDEKNDLTNSPIRFAIPFKVHYNLSNSGNWEERPDGGRIWRLRVFCPGAQSVNFLYDDFYMPEGGLFYIYSPDRKQVLGAFGAHNNRPYSGFATAVLIGEEAILEYFEPASDRGKGRIALAQIAHGYRFFGEDGSEALGDSGACQVNVNCSPEGDNWQTEKRSVARIIVNGSALCTGTLINNSAQDCTPYFLTANHCIEGNFDAVTNPNIPGFVFYWNYERPGCPNTGTPPNETTVGATVVANPSVGGNASASSDFALLRLNSNPADVYNVHFAGFDASGQPGTGGVGIHHPAGDAKKIATHSLTPSSVVSDHYWRVFWLQTANGWSVTEGGSSGSGLFNSNKKLIGQLFGGFAGGQPNCSDPANDEADYGKLSWSWNNNGATDSRRRLRDWLDPVGGGAITVVNGQSTCIPLNCQLNNAGLSNITCHDNGTETPTDDYFTFTLNPTGVDLALSYTVSGANITPTSAVYGAPTLFTAPAGSAGGNNLNLTISDAFSLGCQLPVTVIAPGACSVEIPCSINSPGLANVQCHNNGTTNNPADDYITFQLTVTGTNTSSTYKVLGPISGTNRGSYGITKSFRTTSGTAGQGDITLTLQDLNNPGCSLQVVITDPGVCSSAPPPCNITSSGLSGVTCNNNGTPANASDDRIVFTLAPTGVSTGTSYSVSGAALSPQTGIFGQSTTFTSAAGTAGSGNLNLVISSQSDPGCQLSLTVNNPGSCSAGGPVCSITTANLSGITCQDNGTPSDPADDFIRFSLNPAGTGLGSGYTVSGAALTPSGGSYGISTTFSTQPGTAGAGNLNLVVSDNNSGGCQLNINVQNPGTCSDDPGPDCSAQAAGCQNTTINIGANDVAVLNPQTLVVAPDPSCVYQVQLVSPRNNLFPCSSLGVRTVTIRITDSNGQFKSCSALVTVADPAGNCGEGENYRESRETGIEPTFKIFPNPVKDRLNLEFPAETLGVEVIGSTGIRALALPVAEGQTSMEIDLTGLAPGVYFIRLRRAGSLPFIERFVISR